MPSSRPSPSDRGEHQGHEGDVDGIEQALRTWPVEPHTEELLAMLGGEGGVWGNQAIPAVSAPDTVTAHNPVGDLTNDWILDGLLPELWGQLDHNIPESSHEATFAQGTGPEQDPAYLFASDNGLMGFGQAWEPDFPNVVSSEQGYPSVQTSVYDTSALLSPDNQSILASIQLSPSGAGKTISSSSYDRSGPARGSSHAGGEGRTGPNAITPSEQGKGISWKPMIITATTAHGFVPPGSTNATRMRKTVSMMDLDGILTDDGITALRKTQDEPVSARYKVGPCMICRTYARPPQSEVDGFFRSAIWEPRQIRRFLNEMTRKAIQHQAKKLGTAMDLERQKSGHDIRLYLQQTKSGDYCESLTFERGWLDEFFQHTPDIVIHAFEQMRDSDVRNEPFIGARGSWGVKSRRPQTIRKAKRTIADLETHSDAISMTRPCL